MKVKKLIKLLKKQNPDAQVEIGVDVGFGETRMYTVGEVFDFSLHPGETEEGVAIPLVAITAGELK